MFYRFLSPLLFSFFLAPAFTTYALPSDSLVRMEEITYNSSFEKKAFEDYFRQNKKNYLALFVAGSKETGSSEFSSAHQAYQETLKQRKQAADPIL